MSLTIPPAPNYPNPVLSQPSAGMNPPSEGPRVIALELDWDPTKNAAFTVNCRINQAQDFSQIAGLAVDNSLCGSDVVFIFPDTQQTYTVPAYTPLAIFSVFTNQTQFYAIAKGALAIDVTRVAVLNFTPLPVVIPISQEQNTLISASIPIVDGSTTILGTGISGTLEDLSIGVANPQATGGANFNERIEVQDGTGKLLGAINYAGRPNDTTNEQLLNLSGIFSRFSGGIKVVMTGGSGGGGTLNVNAYYRVP